MRAPPPPVEKRGRVKPCSQHPCDYVPGLKYVHIVDIRFDAGYTSHVHIRKFGLTQNNNYLTGACPRK